MSPPSVPVLKLEKEAPNVTLYLRELSGNKDYQYPPESDMVTCAARAVNVCRAMLNDPFVRQSLMGFIALYSIERPEARFRDLVLVAEQTEMFISSVCNDFPRLFVDDSITSPLVLGYHEKSPCDANFEPSNQCIYLNGENFRSMCNAAIKSQDGIQVTSDTRNYQNWWFLFASILLREIFYVFDTYLMRGQSTTLSGSDFTFLEGHVFGGILSFSHNPTLKTRDKNVPFLTYKDSEYRILLATIEETLKEDIYLPFASNCLSEDGRAEFPEDRLQLLYLTTRRRGLSDFNPSAQAAVAEKLDNKARENESKQKTAEGHSSSS